VTGHEAELVADFQDALGIVDDAVLIRALDILHVVAAKDEREAGVDRLCLEAGIADQIALSGLEWLITEVRMNNAFSHSPWSMRVPVRSRMRP
jgi:hypothetical protein